MRLYTAAASLLVSILVPFVALALGLGDISLKSALNEPFSAEIPLESVQQSELEDLTVALASADTFDRYGLDRPAFLSDFKFAVTQKQNGQSVLRVSSSMPVAEPFVTMLLDVRWSSGRLLREYTVLLDPPLFEANVVQAPAVPAQTAAASASPAQGQIERVAEPAGEVIEPTGLFQSSSESSALSVTSPVIEPVAEADATVDISVAIEPEPAPEPAVEPAPSPAPVAPVYTAPVRSTPPEQVPAPATMPENYTTSRGDTLWGISERVRGGSGLSNNQMMLALYRANPEAFMGNINRLKAGAILRIPAEAELDVPGQTEATAEVIEQNAAWSASRGQESRLQLVAPSETADSESTAARDVTTGPGEIPVGGDVQESAAAERVLDEQAAESERLLQVEDAEMQALQERIGEEQVAADAEVAEEQIFADTEAALEADEAADGEATAPGSVGAAPAAESSFLGGIFGSMWFWGGLALVLLVAFALARVRKAEPEVADAAATGSWTQDIAESAHDETVKDFDQLGDKDDILEAEDGAPIFADDPEFADDPDATYAGSDFPATGESGASQDSGDSQLDEPFAGSFAGQDDDVLGDDLDFRVDADDIFAAPEDDVTPQDAVGQDELELPLEKTISTGAPLNLDQADPIAEAEFHMAYGLYDQAADLLVRALEDTPDNRPYRVKLLEVYFVWENRDGFLRQAQALRSSIADNSDSDWNKVLILGKQLCPDHELFSGTTAKSPAAGSMDLELSDVGETEIDFTLGGGEVQALDLDVGFGSDADGDSDAGVDFNFGESTGDTEGSDELTLNLGNNDGPAVDTVALDSQGIDLDFGTDDGEATMESPTIENPAMGPDHALSDNDATLESDFQRESPTLESPTIENPMVGGGHELSDTDATMESDTLENSMEGATLESPTLDALGANAETTQMPGLEDPTSLEVDLSGLTDLPVDSGDIFDLGEIDDADAADEGAQQPPAGPVFGGDESKISPETENLRLGDEDETVFASLEALGKVAGDTDLSLDEDDAGGDTVEQPSVDAAAGDTAEQPVLSDLSDTGVTDDSQDDFMVDGEAWGLPEDATMTEVGTKLDLARAYIDMGDPDGARSILEEVLDEGEDAQRQEARQLLAELDD